jgi:D-glycero-alpha-D-manno-heptose-7-phosphate kinase
MILTRAPFRITLGGGGTDLPAYYSKHGGFVVSAGIDKYIFLSLNRPVIDDLVRLKYSESETVSHINELRHAGARETLRFMGVEDGIEASSMADASAGTGLATSSAYIVALLKALHTMKREYVSLQDLAEEACKIEMDILKLPAGKQDQYMAAFGGITVLDISPEGKVAVRKAKVSDETIETLNRNMLVFFTNVTRSSSDVLNDQASSLKEEKKDVVESMHYIKELGYKMLEALETGNVADVGKIFDIHWAHKKKTSSKISNVHFDKIYDIAKANGAVGGKISGAGGGGFFTFYVEGENHKKFREAMKELGLREMKYRFDFEGAKVLVDF